MISKKMKIKTLLLFLILQNSVVGNEANMQQADMIIFSHDRPMQLYAFFESVDKYVKNLGEIWLIYRSSTETFEKAYENCFQSFKNLNIKLVKQSNNNYEQNFKPLLMHTIKSTENNYILFAVDDIIVKDYVDLSECIKYLKKTNALGFYLRLGKNITECYTEGIKTPVPNHEQVEYDVYIFEFKNNKGDWGYPYSVDMTLYNKEQIVDSIAKINFCTPNRFEGSWHINEWFYNQSKDKKGLFFENSKIVNVPLNIVQSDCISRNMGLSSFTLLERFNNGLKIDIGPFFKINNKAPHMEFDITFTSQFPFEELWQACNQIDLNKIKELESRYANFLKFIDTKIFNLKNENGYTPLMWAANCQSVDAVRFLLQHNADPNEIDKNRFTALMYACWRGNYEIVDLLIKNKADINAIDVNGTTALSMADRSDSPDKEKIISLLIEQDL